MAARRRGRWSDLSDSYRKRLTGAGITPEAYERGDSLKAARGHSGAYPGPAERRAIWGRYQSGEATLGDVRRVQSWRDSKAFPRWAARLGLSTDAALALSAQGARGPSTWAEAPTFTPAPRGEAWVLTLHYRDGTDADISIPAELVDEVLAFGIEASGDYDLGEIDVAETM